MRSICITGSPWCDLDYVSSLLHVAGMKMMSTASNNDQLDIATWQAQVIVDTMHSKNNFEQVSKVGRFWEQMACDIFRDNIKSSVCGWANAESLRFLEFWFDFESSLNFILVTVQPEVALANIIEKSSDDISVTEILSEWEIQHRTMLRFYHRHPERTLLVDFQECTGMPSAFVKLCTTQWMLPLNYQTQFKEKSPRSPLSLYVAKNLCGKYPEYTKLSNELKTTVISLAARDCSKVDSEPDINSIVSSLRFLQNQSHELQSIEFLCNEFANILQSGPIHSLLSKTQNSVNDSILSRLRCFKESYENTLDKLGILSENYNHKINENVSIIHKLHSVQRELEDNFEVLKIKSAYLQQYKRQWDALLQRYPDYCNYDIASITAINDDSDIFLKFEFSEIAIGHKFLPNLKVELVLTDNQVELHFLSREKAPSPFVRWPFFADQTTLATNTSGNPESSGQPFDIFFGLATTDVSFITTLTLWLLKILISPVEIENLEPSQRQLFFAGVHKLKNFLETPIFFVRYDHVKLKHEQINQTYEHIWLQISNISWNKIKLEKFEFRLSCANVEPEQFGAFPKLEFPESTCKLPFENWHIESSDDFGNKLELRFALPHDMDFDVWRGISDNDRVFIYSLVNGLEYILADLKNSNIKISRPWEDWIQMAHELRDLLILRVSESG